MRQSVVLLVCGLILCGCSRSPAEQLAYLHAEEQYQINKERSERYRQSLEEGNDEKRYPIIVTSGSRESRQ